MSASEFDKQIAEGQKEWKEVTRRIGILVSRLQVLELSIRDRLQMMPDARPMGIMARQDMYQYQVGTELPVTDITSFDSLRDLIKRHNAEARKSNTPELDFGLVALRDALAHGRVASNPNENIWRLIHFSKPKNRMVRVIYNQALSEDWFEEQMKQITSASHELIRYRRWRT